MTIYKKDSSDKHSSFCIGNGLVAAYYHYGNIRQMFGPVYSTPSVFSLTFCETLDFESRRREGTAVWDTSVFKDGKKIGTITDFAHSTEPVLYRVMQWEEDTEITIDSDFSADAMDALTGTPGLLACVPEGSTVFSLCKTDREFYCALLAGGNVQKKGKILHCTKGKSVVYFVAGDAGKDKVSSFSRCLSLCKAVTKGNIEEAEAQTMASWNAYVSRIRKIDDALQRKGIAPKRRAEVLQMVEDVAIALKTQTAKQGGILAGQHYHLAYGRDSYGDVRGYLALGLFEEAKICISSFCDVYKRRGFIPNASGMGVDCAHCHENDASEQTGYCLLYFTDYYAATKDGEFLKENKDFILWLMKVQKNLLHQNMMPFNGDETYIAGGLVPRSAIDNGSMEATAIYMESVERILAVDEKIGLFTPEVRAEYQASVTDTKAAFAENFIEGNEIYINNPKRAEHAPLPAYRHGVCHGCGGIRHLCRTEEKGYLCTDCFGKKPTHVNTDRFTLGCAVLMPIFTGIHLPEAIIREKLETVIQEKRKTDFDRLSDEKLVGYEYGLILYVAVRLGYREGLEDFVDYILSQRDCFGVWSEYYQSGRPFESSCPYRPWESAINMIGVLAYLLGEEMFS